MNLSAHKIGYENQTYEVKIGKLTIHTIVAECSATCDEWIKQVALYSNLKKYQGDVLFALCESPAEHRLYVGHYDGSRAHCLLYSSDEETDALVTFLKTSSFVFHQDQKDLDSCSKFFLGKNFVRPVKDMDSSNDKADQVMNSTVEAFTCYLIANATMEEMESDALFWDDGKGFSSGESKEKKMKFKKKTHDRKKKDPTKKNKNITTREAKKIQFKFSSCM